MNTEKVHGRTVETFQSTIISAEVLNVSIILPNTSSVFISKSYPLFTPIFMISILLYYPFSYGISLIIIVINIIALCNILIFLQYSVLYL